ncbi:MAG: NAD(P)H-dependent oxidoreductase subunit E [Desulfitobacterium hafniense]|nr:NAD(P)H-dependent oxidoreductase subunit E [Desulfitobacterium hafniense]
MRSLKVKEQIVRLGEEGQDRKIMDNEAIDQILTKHQGQAGSLIRVMMEIQEENHWLPREFLAMISEKLEVPFSRVLRIASYYKTFSLTPKGQHEIQICTGTACHIRGAQRVLDTVQDLTGIKPGETDADQKFSLETVNCQGCCTCGPLLKVDEQTHSRISPAEIADALKKYD